MAMPTTRATTPICPRNSHHVTLPLNAISTPTAIRNGMSIRSRKLSTVCLRETLAFRGLRFSTRNLNRLKNWGEGVKPVLIALDEIQDIAGSNAKFRRLRFLGLIVMNLGVEVLFTVETFPHAFDIPVRECHRLAARKKELSFQF